MGLFGSKPEDGMKEFERLRRSLRPAARPTQNGATTDEDEDGSPLEPPMSNVTVQPLSAHHVAAPTAVSGIGQASVVGPGSVWHGTLAVDGSLRVHGRVTGEIQVRDAVHIAEGAEVDAKVQAAVVVVAGHLHGEIEAFERLEISTTGRVHADLVTKALVVHDGAVVEGQLRMVRAESAGGEVPPAEPLARSSSAPVAALTTAEPAAVA